MSVGGRVMALRLAPTGVLEVEQIGLTVTPHWRRLEPLLTNLSSCSIVCCGPLGSGKSTTAAALVRYLSKNEDAEVVSAEYPVEFLQDTVTQVTSPDAAGYEDAYQSALSLHPNALFLSTVEPGTYIWDAYGKEWGRTVLACVNAADAIDAL